MKAEDCAKLQLEALQFHHRYICLLELEDYEAVVRDTNRNLAVFDFVTRFAESEELSWALQQFRPQLLLVQVRARAGEKLAAKRHTEAVREIERGIADLRTFFAEIGRRLQMVGLSDGMTFALPMQQADLASACGMTNVHANRILRALRENGIVTFTNGNVEVRDLAALHEVAEFDDRYLYPSPR